MDAMGWGRVERLTRILGWVCLCAFVVMAGSLAPYLAASSDMVKLRNALLVDPQPADPAWTPAILPAGYLAGATRSVDPKFSELVRRFDLRVDGDDWATRATYRPTASSAGARPGVIRSSPTWPRPIGASRKMPRATVPILPMCSPALAQAAGIFSRSWAFSFDGFGGHGHIFNEIWDRRSGRWIMLDVFNNFYFADTAGRPLSALEARQVLLAGGAPRMIPVAPASPPGYRYPEKAIDYYRRGLPEWYMWWGNNVFEYDGASPIQLASRMSRSVEQLVAVGIGLHPHIRIVQSDNNEPQRTQLEHLRWRLYAVMGAGLGVLLCGLVWRWSFVKQRSAHAG